MTGDDLRGRLAANLSMLFTEFPFLERFQAAAYAGFQFVEFQFPYDHELAAVAAAIDQAGVQLVMHNFPPGNWAAGERGNAVLPAGDAQFQESIEAGLQAAQILGTPRLNCLAGIVENSDGDNIRANLVANFSHAATKLAEVGRDLLIEPLNNIDVSGFVLNRTGDVLSLLDDMEFDNIYLQLDIYHAQVMGENIPAIIESGIDSIGHVQVADCPGRHEPGSGDIDFPRIFDCLSANGYQGTVGCEYLPARETIAGLDWREGLFSN